MCIAYMRIQTLRCVADTNVGNENTEDNTEQEKQTDSATRHAGDK
jgi:hypothetical protein